MFSRLLLKTKEVFFIPRICTTLSLFLLLILLLPGFLPAGKVAAQTANSVTPTQSVSAPPTPSSSPGTTSVSTPAPASQGALLLLQAQLQNQAQQLQQAQQSAFDAKNSAGGAVTLSLIAILFGIVSLVVGALAILSRRSRKGNTQADPDSNPETSEIEAG